MGVQKNEKYHLFTIKQRKKRVVADSLIFFKIKTKYSAF